MKNDSTVTKKDAAAEALHDNEMSAGERIAAMTARLSELTERQLLLSGKLNFDMRIEQSRLMRERAAALDSGEDQAIIITSKKLKDFSERFNLLSDEQSSLGEERLTLQGKIRELDDRLHGITDFISYPADGESKMPYQGRGVM